MLRCCFWATVVLSVCNDRVGLWPNGWMDQDTTWYGGRPRPRPHCVRRGPTERGCWECSHWMSCVASRCGFSL